MLTLRRADDRGHADHGWLDSHHTFSFADYYDPAHMGFRSLRVINDDRVAAGGGFPTHAHRDMEIISCVLEGELAHEDSMGNRSVIRPGELQRMSAGTGVRHSEFNASKLEALHFLQIWVMPKSAGLPPSYEQKEFPDTRRRGQLLLVASPDGAQGSLTLHADARLYWTLLGPGEKVTHLVAPGRHAWAHVATGRVKVGEHALRAGDAASTSDAGSVHIEGTELAQVLVFDLA